MKRFTLVIGDDMVAEKVLWLVEYFNNEGVSFSTKKPPASVSYTDGFVREHWELCSNLVYA